MLSKCKGLTKEMLRSANAQIALLPENGKVLLDNERIRSLALYRMIFLYFAAMKKQLVYKAIANKYDISYREARPIAFVGWVLQDDRAFRNACQASLKTQEIFSLWTLTNELQAFGKRLDIVRHAIKMAANGVSYTARRSYVKRAVADLVPPKPPKPKAPPLDEKSIKLDNIPQKYRAPMITHLERLRDRDHAISSGYTHFGETEVRYYSDERGRTHLSIVADGPDSVVLDNIIGKLMGRDDGVGHTNKELKYRLGRQLMDFLVDKSKLRIDMMVGGTLSSWLGIDMAQRMFTNGYGIFDPAGITKLLARYGPKAQKVTTAIAITDDEGKQLIDYSEG
ncbi:MAG: hypothetical protein Q3962_08980, partial [Corynebacterium sp.]|nr:hypothetical protein [Corynebacterium sp.]